MMRLTPPNNPAQRNSAHRGPVFLPWHREFLRRFELDLRHEAPGVSIPYWEWAADSALPDPKTSPIWQNDFLGGDGSGPDDVVTKGPFKFDPTGSNGWNIVDM